MPNKPDPIFLCFRCEHRAHGYEAGHYPRCECGDLASAVRSCYMYRPARPVVLVRNRGDRRSPFHGALVSARMQAGRLASGEYVGRTERKPHRKLEYLFFWDDAGFGKETADGE